MIVLLQNSRNEGFVDGIYPSRMATNVKYLCYYLSPAEGIDDDQAFWLAIRNAGFGRFCRPPIGVSKALENDPLSEALQEPRSTNQYTVIVR